MGEENDDAYRAHIARVMEYVADAEERLAEVSATAAVSSHGATAKIDLLAFVKRTFLFNADICFALMETVAEDYQNGFSCGSTARSSAK